LNPVPKEIIAVEFDRQFSMTIEGRASLSSRSLDVLNPATGRSIAQAPDASRGQLDAAVAAARKAFPAWRDRPYAERQQLITELGNRLMAQAEDFKQLLTAEQGKSLYWAQLEAAGSAMWLQMVATQTLPVTVNEDGPERRSETHHVPLGVVGGIVPWNFPILLAVMKIAPALLTGNTMVLKPSPYTPLSALKLGELARDVLPPGVLNVVSGGDDLGPWMTAHPGIDKISFTGSTVTGRSVMRGAADTLKRITLELGGNDPAIVLPDVDVASVVPQLFWAAFLNSGQLCLATKRMYIHEDIYDQVASALVEFSRSVTVGDGALPETQLGPIQNRAQYQRVLKLIAEARAQGLTFLTGQEPMPGPGYFVPVTLIDNPPDDAPVVTEEAFGPVLPLLKFRDVDEVIGRANNSPYGLGASIWTRDEALARSMAARLECGTVWINEIHYSMPNAALGGHKQSGIGVENGLEGLLEYTATQTRILRKQPAPASLT
jgi:acyl-CoA reductase-like NAD-dependent aldehyde dehydrogenase